jgi:hypothetical protein
MIDWRKSSEAELQLGKTVATNCAKHVSAPTTAIALVELDLAGKVTSTVVLADQHATAKLRACISQEIAATTFSMATGMAKREIRVELKHP